MFISVLLLLVGSDNGRAMAKPMLLRKMETRRNNHESHDVSNEILRFFIIHIKDNNRLMDRR